MFGLGFGSKPFAGGVRSISSAQPPATPSNFQATANDAFVDLTWDSVSDATSYEVAIGTSANPTNWWDVGNVTSFQIGGLLNDTTYYVRVRAVNGNGAGTPTSDATPTPTSDSGYTQWDADNGWRKPNQGITTSYGGRTYANVGSSDFTHYTIGIQHTASFNFPNAWLNMSTDYPVRRIRARIYETNSSPTGAVVLYFRSNQSSWGEGYDVRWLASGTVQLNETTANSTTTHRSASVTRSTGWHTIEIVDDGNTISLLIDGSAPFSSYSSTSKTSSAYSYIGFELGTIGNTARLNWISWDRQSTGGTIEPSSIGSNAGLGSHTVTSASTIEASSISSNITFGSTELTYTSTISASGISSNATFGSTELTYTAVIDAASIGSGITFGSTTLDSQADVVIDGIGSTLTFGSHTVGQSGSVSLSGIASDVAFGTHALSYTSEIAAPAIDPALQIGAATLTFAATITTSSFGGVVIGDHAISYTAILSPISIDSIAALGTPEATSNSLVVSQTIASGIAFGGVALTYAAAIADITIGSVTSFGAPTLAYASTVAPVYYDSYLSVLDGLNQTAILLYGNDNYLMVMDGVNVTTTLPYNTDSYLRVAYELNHTSQAR